jgi:hypothetical protein
MYAWEERQPAIGGLLNFKNDHRLIVKDLGTGGELFCCPEDCVHNLPGSAVGVLCDYVFDTAAAKRFCPWRSGVKLASKLE